MLGMNLNLVLSDSRPLFIQLVEHIIHSYLRSLGRVSVVLGITLFGSAVRVAATLLLIPVMYLDGAFLGQILSWGADTAVSVFLFLGFYRTEAQLERVIASLPVKSKAKDSAQTYER